MRETLRYFRVPIVGSIIIFGSVYHIVVSKVEGRRLRLEQQSAIASEINDTFMTEGRLGRTGFVAWCINLNHLMTPHGQTALEFCTEMWESAVGERIGE